MPNNHPPLFQPLRFAVPLVNVPNGATESRAERIAEIAYFRSQNRGFEPGHDVEDWLAAEAEVDGVLTGTSVGDQLP